MKNIFGEFENLRYKGQRTNELIPPYMQDFYNVRELYYSSNGSVQYAPHAMIRALNTLNQVIADQRKLPKYLIVVMDTDIIKDLDVFDQQAPIIIQELVRWFV